MRSATLVREMCSFCWSLHFGSIAQFAASEFNQAYSKPRGNSVLAKWKMLDSQVADGLCSQDFASTFTVFLQRVKISKLELTTRAGHWETSKEADLQHLREKVRLRCMNRVGYCIHS